MFSHTIGEVALNASLLLYFIWFIPQLILTAKRRTTAGLSLCMHTLLIVAYITDLIYGFGRELPLQYKCVTVFGLSMLVVEHCQFLYYAASQQKMILHWLTLFFIVSFLLAIYFVTTPLHSKALYDGVGFFSCLCWLAFLWPQIIKNFQNQSVVGCSVYMIWIVLLAGIGNCISAFTLAWDWPSQIGASIGLVPTGLLLTQYFYYQKRTRKIYAKVI